MDRQNLETKLSEVSKSIFSYCMSKTSNRSDAEDLAQDILLELIKSSQNMRDDKAFYSFMWSVAANVYKQWYKKKLKYQNSELTEDIKDMESNFDSIFQDNSDIFTLRRELALLSEKYRRAAILYYIENKSCAEISSLLSVSESMVKYLLFKSRKILKDGMNMERNLGKLSYNPKKLIPNYSGEGPNHFYSFMNSLIRQNIVLSCYNDSLTPESISLETGIPLPYVDDEIRELVDKKLLINKGKYYSANVIIISRECTEEICQKLSDKYEYIADKIISFVNSYIDEYRSIGFYGSDFSENTLRWQLSTLMWRKIFGYAFKPVGVPAITGWGEHADIWLMEDTGNIVSSTFNYCTVDSRNGDSILFFDYLPAQKGSHTDFFGSQQYIDIICSIAKQSEKILSEYDLEAIAEMIKKSYVISEDGKFRVTFPVYSTEQYQLIDNYVERFMLDEIGIELEKLDLLSEKILAEHSPQHLKDSVIRVSGHNKFYHAVCVPAKIMIEKKFLSTAYNPSEMPSTFIILSNK